MFKCMWLAFSYLYLKDNWIIFAWGVSFLNVSHLLKLLGSLVCHLITRVRVRTTPSGPSRGGGPKRGPQSPHRSPVPIPNSHQWAQLPLGPSLSGRLHSPLPNFSVRSLPPRISKLILGKEFSLYGQQLECQVIPKYKSKSFSVSERRRKPWPIGGILYITQSLLLTPYCPLLLLTY